MHASVRTYDHIVDHDRTLAVVQEGLAPVIRATPGFVSYQLINVGPTQVASVTVTESEEAMRAVDAAAAEFLVSYDRADVGERVDIREGAIMFSM